MGRVRFLVCPVRPKGAEGWVVGSPRVLPGQLGCLREASRGCGSSGFLVRKEEPTALGGGPKGGCKVSEGFRLSEPHTDRML